MFDFLKKSEIKKTEDKLEIKKIQENGGTTLEATIKYVTDEKGVKYASIPEFTTFLEKYKLLLVEKGYSGTDVDILSQLIENLKAVYNKP